MAYEERMARGKARMAELWGDDFALEVEGDFMELTTGHVLGDIWTRAGLELRERSLITCAALVAMGKEPELKGHLYGALNIGISREAVEEMMIHLAHYSGWPTAVNGLRIAREVFAEQDGSDQG